MKIPSKKEHPACCLFHFAASWGGGAKHFVLSLFLWVSFYFNWLIKRRSPLNIVCIPATMLNINVINYNYPPLKVSSTYLIPSATAVFWVQTQYCGSPWDHHIQFRNENVTLGRLGKSCKSSSSVNFSALQCSQNSVIWGNRWTDTYG